MKFSAQELSDMVSKRQFQQVIDLWKKGNAHDDEHTLYQVFVAATMVQDLELVDELREQLPPEMIDDASRDVLLMQIRTRTVPSVAAAFAEAERLEMTAPDDGRKAVTLMTFARLARLVGGAANEGAAQAAIHEAFGLVVARKSDIDPQWRRNVAFWYLVIGTAGMRRQALDLVLKDPSRWRRMIARFCYDWELGRIIPIY